MFEVTESSQIYLISELKEVSGGIELLRLASLETLKKSVVLVRFL